MHESLVLAARAVFGEFAGLVWRSRIIACADNVDIMSADDFNAYREGITSSHFVVGGIDLMITPLHASSFIAGVVKLSTITFRVRNNFICSEMCVPSVYMV